MIIRPIGQSGYIVKTETATLVIDPYLSDAVNRVAGRPRLLPVPVPPEDIVADAVICTHDHIDHLDPDSVGKMPENTHFITTAKGREVLFEKSQTNVSVLTAGECKTIGDCKIIAVFARHTTEAFGIVLKAEGKTLYFSGDTLFDEELFDLSSFSPDACFICINGRLGNMNVEEALAVAKAIGAPCNIPNHYDMFASNSEDPHKFADHIEGGRILDFNKDYVF